MAVPGASSNYLKNTTGGAYVDQKQGGSILGNTTVGDVVTKALALKDNAVVFSRGTLPAAVVNGLITNQKVLSGGTFAYEEAGKYVIATISDTISGVAKNNILITGRGEDMNAIQRFQRSFGAKTVSAFRANRFSWTSTKRTGAALGSRKNWTTAIASGGDAAGTPDALNEFMYDIADGNATNIAFDSAAQPTRALPGELVMKVDFVTLTVASGGDFFDYKPITGM